MTRARAAMPGDRGWVGRAWGWLNAPVDITVLCAECHLPIRPPPLVVGRTHIVCGRFLLTSSTCLPLEVSLR